MNEDDFLQALADGGNQVGDLAKVYYDIQPDADLAPIMGYDQSVERTSELFKQDTVNTAEAAFRWENCFVRADIIEKKGKVINLIEVKAKLQFSTPAEAKALAEALLRYCELDTMSMVFIWEYFHEKTGK